MYHFLQRTDELPLIPLRKGMHVVGRDRDCDLRFPRDLKMSRRHCCFVEMGDGYGLCDLGSTNGVELNGERVSGHHQLQPDDEIRIGRTFFIYRVSQSDPPPPFPSPSLSVFERFGVSAAVRQAAARQDIESSPVASAAIPPRPPWMRKKAARSAPDERSQTSQRSNSPAAELESPDRELPDVPSSELPDVPIAVPPLAGVNLQSDAELQVLDPVPLSDAQVEEHLERVDYESGDFVDLTESVIMPVVEAPASSESRAPKSQSSEIDINRAVALARDASRVNLVDIVCPECRYQFCHIQDEGASESDEVECQSCHKKIKLSEAKRLATVETQLEAVPDHLSARAWRTTSNCMDHLAGIGLTVAVVLMFCFTVLCGKGIGHFASLAGGTFIPTPNTELAPQDAELVGAGVFLVVFGFAPLAILATIRIVAEEMTLLVFAGLIAGGCGAITAWTVAGIHPVTFLRFTCLIYAGVAIATVTGTFGLANRPPTPDVRGYSRGATAGFILAAIVLVLAAVLDPGPPTSRKELVGAPRLAGILLAATLCWTIGHVSLVAYMRHCSTLLEQPRLTEVLDQHSVSTVFSATLICLMLVGIAMEAVTGSMADAAWVVSGMLATLHAIWMYQQVRFTNYAIR